MAKHRIARKNTARRHAATDAPPTLGEKARHRKGAVVEKVTHPDTQRTAPIRLDKGSMVFFAELGEGPSYTSAESKDGREVRDWLMYHLAKSTAEQRLEWIPVVHVDDSLDSYRYGDDDDDAANMKKAECSVKIERFFLALTHDKKEWRVLTWAECADDSATQLADDDRYTASKKFRDGPAVETVSRFRDREKAFGLPYFEKGSHGGSTYLRYTPELWAGLVAVVDRVEETRRQLRVLVSTKKGIESVFALGSGNGALMLGAGES
jgi:Ni/Co efflux regulator RcnB